MGKRMDRYDMGNQTHNVKAWARDVSEMPTESSVLAFLALQTTKRPTKAQLEDLTQSAVMSWRYFNG